MVGHLSQKSIALMLLIIARRSNCFITNIKESQQVNNIESTIHPVPDISELTMGQSDVRPTVLITRRGKPAHLSWRKQKRRSPSSDVVAKKRIDEETFESTAILSPLEALCQHKMDVWYETSQRQKCPFLRRRLGDILDNLELCLKHIVIRKKCWGLIGPPRACRSHQINKRQVYSKLKNVSKEQLHHTILEDWKTDTGKGYYITGKLTTSCYRDDCLFLGPDPDMPILGLRKYVGVAAQLFETETSKADLLSLEFDNSDRLVAHWELTGILRLPWKPALPRITGKTTYIQDADGLIQCHEESWDISVLYAFMYTFFPQFTNRFWPSNT